MRTFDQQQQQSQQQTSIVGSVAENTKNHSKASKEIQVGHITDSHTVAIGENISVIYQGIIPRQVDETRLADALARLAQLPTDDIPTPAPPPNGSRLIYRVNHHFVGREQELQALAQYFKDGATAVVAEAAMTEAAMQTGRSEMAITTGLGGIGKTQLAATFAHHYGQYFAGGVYWVSLADAQSVMSEIALCGQQMAAVEPTMQVDFATQSLEAQVQQVLALWQSPLPRLLIFDNCEDADLLAQWHPPTGGCRVLVTSRRQRWSRARGMYTMPLTTLTREQSVALLLKFRPDLNVGAGLASDQINTLNDIAAGLGDLPLALHLAGSYLEAYEYDITPEDYLAELRSPHLLEHESLQDNEDGFSPTGHDAHVAQTFALSIQRLNPDDVIDALSLDLLARAAHFAPGEPIPRTLLLATLRTDADKTQLSRALRRLSGLGLLAETDAGALVVHRLVMYFVHGLKLAPYALATVEEVLAAEAEPINEGGDPTPLMAWQPHLRHAVAQAGERKDARAAALYYQFGAHLYMVGAYPQAIHYTERSLTIRCDVLGEKHAETAKSLHNLGLFSIEKGEYDTSQSYLEQALSIMRKGLGEMNKETAICLSSISSLHWRKGEYEVARRYLEQALFIMREVLGEMRKETAVCLNNLGSLHWMKGEYEVAQPYFEQALSIMREVLGEMHPLTAQPLYHLGLIHRGRRAYEAAQPYFEQTLSIWRGVYGGRHPRTAICMDEYGMLLQDLKQYERAKTYCEQALTIRLEVLGEEHDQTALSFSHLGIIYREAGAYDKALLYSEKAFVIVQEVFGKKHPHTASSLCSIGRIKTAMQQYDQAQPYYEQALSTQLEVLGEKHPHTAFTRHSLGVLFDKTEQFDEAITHFEQALAIREAVLGVDHPDTQGTRRHLDDVRGKGSYICYQIEKN
ncbi:MAG: tetratricopeptide repeat protein [Chloroflexota bacterium]